MGRGKLPMELIANEKSRSSTFNKRKKGLKKKLDEFTTLCDVDACMIVYGPHHDGRPMELDIWPQDMTEVRRIIGKYKSKGVEEKAKRNHDLSDFFEKRKHKIDDDIVKMRRANNRAKYPTWDSRLYHATIDQLMLILNSIDSKIDEARLLTDRVQETPHLIKGGAPKMIGYTHMQPSPQSYPTNNVHGLYQRDMQLEANRHFQEIKPLDSYLPQNYMLDQGLQTCSFDINSYSRTSPTMKMLMNDDYCLGSSSSTNLQYTPPLKSSNYYEPTSDLVENEKHNSSYPRTLLENEMYNSYPRSSCTGYYSPPIMQQPVQRQFAQRPINSSYASQVMMPSAPSQVNNPQVTDNFYEVSDYHQIMNKTARYY